MSFGKIIALVIIGLMAKTFIISMWGVGFLKDSPSEQKQGLKERILQKGNKNK